MLKKLILIITISLYSYSNEIELSGTVISDNEKIITSRNMGYIKSVNANEGEYVKKGKILYEIDSSNIDSKKQEILLNLQIQNNNLNNTQTNYNRYKRLYKQDLIPKYDLEQLELNLSNQKSMISITKAKLKEINEQYKYLKVKAPNNGIIIKKTIKTGEMAMPGNPAFVLSDLSNLKIKTDLPESYLNKVSIGQDVNIEIPSINFTTKGKISALIPNINSVTHSFILKVSFKAQDKIYPGMYTKMYIAPLKED